MRTDGFRFWSDSVPIPEAVAILEPFGTIVQQGEVQAGAFAEADAALVGTLFPGTAETFARAKRLRVVARFGIGYDGIDVAAATAAGICVVNTPEAPTESTAEFAVGLIFAAARRIPRGESWLRSGQWWPMAPILAGVDLRGRTLGLVGFGRIARRVAEMMRAVGMRVAAFDPFVPAARIEEVGAISVSSLIDLLELSDVISVHVPLTQETIGLIGVRELARIRRGAIVVNTARGPIIDEGALAVALADGRVSFAAIDVWAEEPAHLDNPLLQMENVIATPHMAANTGEGKVRSHTTAARLVLEVLQGTRPSSLVNPEVWDRRRH